MGKTSSWDEYQAWAVAGNIVPPGEHPLAYPALGLAGEAGEYCEHVKKQMRDGKLDEFKAARELGDVLWYLAVSAHRLGFTLSEIAKLNYDKLEARAAKNAIQGSGDVR